MIAALLAVAVSFTATATGVERGMPVEFAFASSDSDRAYEAMFILDEPIEDFCGRLEKAGLKRGSPTDAKGCRLWPVGIPVWFEPALTNFIAGTMPAGLPPGRPIYTGGTRLADGQCEASSNMPSSVYALYSLAQSPIVFDGIYEQGVVYNSFTARTTLKKGERYSFTVNWDEGAALAKHLHLTVRPGQSSDVLRTLKAESANGPVEALIGFADDLTVREATAVANALATVDSVRIKINGCSNVFYRAFLPLVKWRDRKERLVQPFELTLGNPDKLVFINEDWTVDGDDPRLEPTEILFDAASSYKKTTTCFIYADDDTPISRITAAMDRLKESAVRNWYVFSR